MEEESKSLTWIIVMMMGVIALFGWGFLAGSYEGAHATPLTEKSDLQRAEEMPTRARLRRPGIGKFVANAIEQLPKFGTVISWHLANRIWLPITIVALEVGVLLGALVLKRIENTLEPRKKRRRKKR